MDEQPDESELLAFVDGELSSQRRRAIEQWLASRPDLRDRLEHVRALRILSRRGIRDSTPAVSLDLRSKVEAIATAHGSDPASDRPGSGLAVAEHKTAPRFARRLALAASILLCIGIGSWLVTTRTNHRASDASRIVVRGRAASGLSVQTVSLLEARHLKCSMMGNNFTDPSFPRELKDLGPAVRQYLGDGAPSPDLTHIGLDFAGAGPCEIPGGRTLHWLYRSRNAPPVNVSLFVQPFAGQVSFGPDKAVEVAGPTEKHPMLVWRDGKFVYYLVGDDFGATSESAKVLGAFGG